MLGELGEFRGYASLTHQLSVIGCQEEDKLVPPLSMVPLGYSFRSRANFQDFVYKEGIAV